MTPSNGALNSFTGVRSSAIKSVIVLHKAKPGVYYCLPPQEQYISTHAKTHTAVVKRSSTARCASADWPVELPCGQQAARRASLCAHFRVSQVPHHRSHGVVSSPRALGGESLRSEAASAHGKKTWRIVLPTTRLIRPRAPASCRGGTSGRTPRTTARTQAQRGGPALRRAF